MIYCSEVVSNVIVVPSADSVSLVGDVALLRAAGSDIDATPRGYILRQKDSEEARAKRALL